MKICVYVDFVLPFSRWFFLFPICRVAVRFWGSFNASVIFHFNFHSPCPSSTKISHILCHFSSKDLVMRQKLITILLALKSLRWALANASLIKILIQVFFFSQHLNIFTNIHKDNSFIWRLPFCLYKISFPAFWAISSESTSFQCRNNTMINDHWSS